MVAKIFSVLVLFFSISSVWAITPINGSYEKHYDTENKSSHWLILGAIERIKGAVKPEAEIRVPAKVRSWLWQLPSGQTSDVAFEQMKGQVQDKTTTLFECHGRSCGLSNDFGNQVFEQSILYGRDSNQHYWLGLQKKAKGAQLWLVYSVQRSNKRVYVYVERIDVKAEHAPVFDAYLQKGRNTQLFKEHFSVLTELDKKSAQLTETQVTWMKELLHEYPNKKFALVVHRYQKIDSQRLIDETTTEARNLVEQLAQAGAFIKNLYSHGAGAWLPRKKLGARVELVVLTDGIPK